jgi:hypothetical protein
MSGPAASLLGGAGRPRQRCRRYCSRVRCQRLLVAERVLADRAVVEGERHDGTIDVVQVSASTGRQVRVLFQENTGNGVFYRLFSSDPSGRFMILDAGPPQGAILNGWIDHGRLVLLKPADGSSVFQESW